jgi:hypothetical protein
MGEKSNEGVKEYPSNGETPSGKNQAPRSKLQRNSKSQIPNPKKNPKSKAPIAEL